MNCFDILNIEPTIYLEPIIEAYMHRSNNISQQEQDALEYLQDETNRLTHYATVKQIKISSTRLEDLVTSNNLIEIIVIVKILKTKHSDTWLATSKDVHYAIRRAILDKKIQIVRFLLEVGVSVHTEVPLHSSQNRFRPTIQPLIYYGITSGSIEIVQLLVSYGANLKEGIFYMKNRAQNNVAQSKLQNEYLNMLTVLLDNAIGVDLAGKKNTPCDDGIHLLAFLQKQNISKLNFVGLSVAGHPVTKAMLNQVGALNVDKALFSINDYITIDCAERQHQLTNRIHTKAAQLCATINPDGTVNLVELWRLADIGDYHTLSTRLAAGSDPNEPSSNISPLIAAAKKGHLNCVISLINAPTIQKTMIGEAIGAAITANMTHISNYLFSTQDINTTDIQKNTMLHLAAEAGLVSTVKDLLLRGADVNAQNEVGETALKSAIEQKSINNERLEIIRLLIEYKVNPKIYAVNSPLYYAIIGDSPEAAALLLPHSDKNDVKIGLYPHRQKTVPWYVPLMFYAVTKKNNITLLGLLKQYGADFNIKNDENNTLLNKAILNLPSLHSIQTNLAENVSSPIHSSNEFELYDIAHSCQAFDCIIFLLKEGADPGLCDHKNQSALAHLIQKELFPIGSAYDALISLFVLKGGITIQIQAENGYTALHNASQINDITTVKTLILNGVNVNIQTPDKQTALHLAAINGYSTICDCLLDAGAEKNIKDKMEQTPFDCTIKHQKMNHDSIFFNQPTIDKLAEKQFYMKYVETRHALSKERQTKPKSELIRQRELLHTTINNQAKEENEALQTESPSKKNSCTIY